MRLSTECPGNRMTTSLLAQGRHDGNGNHGSGNGNGNADGNGNHGSSPRIVSGSGTTMTAHFNFYFARSQRRSQPQE
jgi:hypothetical protein